jgi:CheY-like chemotaxis protein
LIPAVALTAQVSIEDESRALAEGFSEFVRKPYRFDDLVDAVASAARSSRDPDEGPER